MPSSTKSVDDIVIARTAALDAREERLDAREQLLNAREDRIEKRELQIQRCLDRMLERESRLLDHMEKGKHETADKKHGGNATAAPDPGAHADPIHNVPRLLHLYRLNGGVLPPGLLVAEVVALKEAATYYQDLAASLESQIKELKDRLEEKGLWGLWRQTTEALIDNLTKQVERAHASMHSLMESFARLRSVGIQRLVPNLLKSANHFDAVFEESIHREECGEATLARIGCLCAKITTKGNELRQPLPSALAATSLHTLLLLLEHAMHAAPRLQRLLERATAGRIGCEILPPPEVTKSIPRALEKVQTEYAGEYTRLLDYVRSTVVCDTLLVFEEVLAWLCSNAASAVGFTVCRIKDRISRDGGYDPEISGGNRDVLINGWLDMGIDRVVIVEIQLHVRAMFLLKADLHTLYDGARVLGNLDPAITSHAGVLSEGVIKKAEQGVLRIINTPFSRASAEQVERIAEVMQHVPNAIQFLDLCYLKDPSGNRPLEKWTLERFLVPATGSIACTRLKHINLCCGGLSGPVPRALKQCRMLDHIGLNTNFIEGPIPEWLPEMQSLRRIEFARNWFSGTLDTIGKCTRLQVVSLEDNCLEGELPASCLQVFANMDAFTLGAEDMEHMNEECRSHAERLKTRPGHGNSRLRVTEKIKAELCRLWAEESRLDVECSRVRPDHGLYASPRPHDLDKDCRHTWPALA